jgi:hypothetical protein
MRLIDLIDLLIDLLNLKCVVLFGFVIFYSFHSQNQTMLMKLGSETRV